MRHITYSIKKLFTEMLLCFIRDKELRTRKRAEWRGLRLNPDKIKLVMTLLVKNEEDYLETNLKFHKEMGVDGFIVTDNGSTDKTRDILEKYKKLGWIYEIIDEPSVTYDQRKWVDRMIRRAKDRYKATWVINSDADEFYYSRSQNLKKSIALYPHLNAFSLDAFPCFPAEVENDFANPYYVKKDTSHMRLAGRYENLSEKNAALREIVIMSKVIHQTKDYLMISKGNHNVKMLNKIMASNNDIVCYHLHLSSYERFVSRVQRWMESDKHIPEDSHANAIEHLKNGTLQDAFHERYNAEMRQALIEDGIVVKDKDLYDFLTSKGILPKTKNDRQKVQS